jgi:hypothetical protein
MIKVMTIFVITIFVMLFLSFRAEAQFQPPASADAPVGAPDSSKLPDIGGIHLGMTMPEAKAALQKAYPAARIDAMNGGALGPQHQSAVSSFRVQGDNTGHNQTGVDLTYPPNAQVVWHVARTSPQQVARGTLIAALREKYGREAFALDGESKPTANESAISEMYWLFDEQGKHLTATTLLNGSPYGCAAAASTFTTTGTPADFYLGVASNRGGTPTGYCAASYVGVHVAFGAGDILPGFSSDVVDLPLMVRSSMVTDAWAKGVTQKAYQDSVDKSKQAKVPTF